MRNELTFHNHENGLKVAEMLLKEDYVVMLSYEESLLVLNYEWSERGADRNDVVFMPKWEFEELEDKICDDVLNAVAVDVKAGCEIESILGSRLK